ncbi:MAG: topoisomerase DNA-binding C4 zinc finger domain-containing protein [bacterium]|nr:topoisomerase DNA-binding C4 zinc finger domain-containing protein [bacterium]
MDNNIESYKQKLDHIKNLRIGPKHSNLKSICVNTYKETTTDKEKCPKCKEGSLILRKGINGIYWGCTRYPLCDYKRKFETERSGTDEFINEKFIDDMRKAYSKL